MTGAVGAVFGGLALRGAAAQIVTPAATELVCDDRAVVCNEAGRTPAVCGGDGSCLCARLVNGSKRCVKLSGVTCPRRDQCDTNNDCGTNEVCIVVSGCCEGTRKNICVPRCS